jgi:hypothetical protein
MSEDRLWSAAGMIALVIVIVVGVITAVNAIADAAPRTATTLHFFSWERFEALYDRYGYALRITERTPLLAGERYVFASDDFAGTHRHHARRASGSDRVDCAIVKTNQGLCSVRLTLGRSSIRGERFPLYFSRRVTRLKITGGTGRYRGARGTITATTPSLARPGTELTIRVRAAGA